MLSLPRHGISPSYYAHIVRHASHQGIGGSVERSKVVVARLVASDMVLTLMRKDVRMGDIPFYLTMLHNTQNEQRKQTRHHV